MLSNLLYVLYTLYHSGFYGGGYPNRSAIHFGLLMTSVRRKFGGNTANMVGGSLEPDIGLKKNYR